MRTVLPFGKSKQPSTIREKIYERGSRKRSPINLPKITITESNDDEQEQTSNRTKTSSEKP